MTSPALWSTDHPQLYTARTDLSVGGAAADTVATPFGIRYVTFDPAAGFSLNGQYLKIQGVNLHATEGAVGSAVRFDAMARQMQLMKSMGVNALRTAHNPPAPELIAVCEQLGIVMMVEAFDCWHTGKLPYDYHLYFDQWSDSDIKEMVNAAKNSPAVVLWSIGNETPDTGSSRGPGIAKQLVADVKSIDTSRPVVMGSDQYRSVPATGSPQDLIVAELDGLGVNYNTAMSMDGLHAKYPGKFFFCSEMGSETSTRGVYQDPQLLNTGENYTPGKRATSSYDNNLASWTMSGEYELKKDRDRQVLERGVPVVGAGLHRRADPVRRVPGQGVVLRRDGHGRIRQGRLLPVPRASGPPSRWCTSCRWTGPATSPASPSRSGCTRTWPR